MLVLVSFNARERIYHLSLTAGHHTPSNTVVILLSNDTHAFHVLMPAGVRSRVLSHRRATSTPPSDGCPGRFHSAPAHF